MSKKSIETQEMLYCGIDVSAKSLTVAIHGVWPPEDQRSFPNNPNGHKVLIVWLRKAKSPVRVSLAATGIYSLDLACSFDSYLGSSVHLVKCVGGGSSASLCLFQARWRTRSLSRSNFARPYICRLISLRRWT
jgi:hypothetical protein